MGYVSVHPPNSFAILERALKGLAIVGNEVLDLPGRPTSGEYLFQCIDLMHPFNADNLPNGHIILQAGPSANNLNELVIDVLERLAPAWKEHISLTDLCSRLPTISPRIFSIASAESKSTRNSHTLDIFVHARPGGRFSEQFLASVTDRPIELRYKIHGMSFLSFTLTLSIVNQVPYRFKTFTSPN